MVSRVTLLISLIISVGTILLLVSHSLADKLASEMGRDFGIALFSTGVISVAYELVIRKQLLDDHEARIKPLLNPDAERLGVEHIFANRDERSACGLGIDALIDSVQSELFIYGVAPRGLVTESRLHLNALIRRGGTVKLLLSTPNGGNQTAIEDTLGTAHEDVQFTVSALNTLRRQLKDEGLDDRLSVRCHDCVPPFGAVGVDIETQHGVFLVELNGVKMGDNEHPSLKLRHQDGGLYELYRRQLDDLWKTSTRLEHLAPTPSVPLIERGIKLGRQEELYKQARDLCVDRGARNAVYYHYSGSIAQATITELLYDGWEVELYVQSPQVAVAMNAPEQMPRISGMLGQVSHLDPTSRSHLTVRKSVVPNSVRAAIFGEQIIVLGWYYYSALTGAGGPAAIGDAKARVKDHRNFGLPAIEVKGHDSFGILIERSNPAFSKAKEFLESYQSGLSAELVQFS